jgi:dienelactone hydrolase
MLANLYLQMRFSADSSSKIIPGGGASPAYIDKIATLSKPVGWTDIRGQLNRLWIGVQVIPPMVVFMYRTKPAAVYPTILAYARNVKKDLPEGGKLGVAGFCWGGYGSTMLCLEPTVDGGVEKLIDAQFCAHPSKLDFQRVIPEAVVQRKVPYSMAIGDLDRALKKEVVEELRKTLKEKIGEQEKDQYEIKTYDGCKHGFALRADAENKVEIGAAEQAAKQAVDWFNKHLHSSKIQQNKSSMRPSWTGQQGVQSRGFTSGTGTVRQYKIIARQNAVRSSQMVMHHHNFGSWCTARLAWFRTTVLVGLSYRVATALSRNPKLR